MSLEKGPSVVTKAVPSISHVVPAHFMGTTVEEDSEETMIARSIRIDQRVKGYFSILGGLLFHGRVDRIFI